jgi:2-polyprenyl-3-methyl-5-hydroxy-6-metoxy-1,4-benzoquinol methylase
MNETCLCCSSPTAYPGWGPPELRVCPSCGSGWLPASAAPAEEYSAAYFDGTGPGGVDYEGSKPQFQLINHRRLDSIEAHSSGLRSRRLLELGCALGFFMEAAESRGWEPWGVELSSFAAAKAQQRYGERVLCGTLEQAPAAWTGFGLATAFHVMEHLPEPRAALQDLGRRLVPGGLIAFEVPDFGSRTARSKRATWKYFLPGEHLNYFTQAGLRALLESEGFEVLAFEATSFTRLLGPLDQAGLGGIKRVVLRFLPWLRWIKSAVLGLRGWMGGHDCVLVIARKREAV